MQKSRAKQHINTRHRIYLQPAMLILIVGLAITVVVLLTNQVQAHAQKDSDIYAIENVVTTAMVAPASITVGNPASFPLAKNSIIPATALRQTNTSIALARAQAHATFSSIYAANCLACQSIASGIDKSLAIEAKGQFHALGGGIRDIQWRQVIVDGSTASVTISATIWARYASLDPQGKVQIDTPIAGYVTIYALIKSNGHWLITNQIEDSVAADALPINQHAVPSATPSTTPKYPAKKITAPILVKGKIQPTGK